METFNKSWCIGELNIKEPIVQGGMGIGVSLSSLASAVANEGGIGVLSAAGIGLLENSRQGNFEKKADNVLGLQNEIQKARQMTKQDGVLGVNIMVALTDFDKMATTAMDAGIDVIFAGAGLPLHLPGLKKPECKTKLVPIVSSGKAAKLIIKYWMEKFEYMPDAIVVEGPLAGGHLGFKLEQLDDINFSLENILVDVIAVVNDIKEKTGKDIPVIAGGGVYDGGDIKRILDLGACAVQMATRFVATVECDASENFKQAYINCKEEDITIIKSPVGMPGRAIAGEFLQGVSRGEKTPKRCLHNCIITCKGVKSDYCISNALICACNGELDGGFVFIGGKGYLVNEIVTVNQLFSQLINEYTKSV